MIESLENKNIKNIKKLRDKKYRDKENKFVVEIPNVIKEALNNNLLIELYVKENTSFDIDFPVTYIKESIFNKIKTIGTTNVIGIIKKEENNKLVGTKYILLDSIGDPGNLGTIIRSAVAFNIDTIVLSKDTVDLYNPKVVRSNQGMMFHINIISRDPIKFINGLKKKDYNKLYKYNDYIIEQNYPLDKKSVFNLINKMPVSNNSVVSINGSVTYCSRRGKLFCLGYTTKDFNTYGVLNKDYNVSRLNNLFKYTINNIDIDDSKVIVDDNLVDIYRLNTTKVIENKDPKYVVSADIYKIERVHKYRVVGTVSNITINPKYKIEFTKTKNVLKYHLVGLAKKDIYKDIYVVTYNLKKMTEEKEIKYIQNFKVVEVKNYYSYSLSLLAHLNLNGIGGVNNDNNINIPNTGLNDKDYSIMIILLIITIVISIKLIFKRNS